MTLQLVLVDQNPFHPCFHFVFDAPTVFDKLPDEICPSSFIVSFRKKLRSFLFLEAYPPWPPLFMLCLCGAQIFIKTLTFEIFSFQWRLSAVKVGWIRIK